MLEKYLIPWLVSNAISLLLILVCYKWQRGGTIIWAVIFILASIVNSWHALFLPESYLEYAELTIFPFYRNFINGFFALHIQSIVLTIAGFQFLIGIGLWSTSWPNKIPVIGAIIFLLCITPFGIGSGFPATILMIVSLLMLLRK